MRDRVLGSTKGHTTVLWIQRSYGSSPETLSSLTFTGKGHPSIILQQIPAEAYDLDNIARSVGIVYRGESLGAFGEKLRIEFTKKRIPLTPAVKREVEIRQGG